MAQSFKIIAELKVYLMSSFKDLREIDSDGMIDDVLDFPEMCEKAFTPIIDSLDSDFKKIGVIGMGGSGIGGDMTKSFLKQKTEIPVIVNKDYWLPKSIDEDTLLFVISYSGNTEETLSSLREALDRGCEVLGVSSDGELKEISKENDFPLFEVKKGIQPRAAFPYLFLPIIATLEELGLIKVSGFKEALANLRKLREKNEPQVELEENPAKKLGLKLKDSIPIVYSYSKLSSVAYRWKCQLNENSKMFSVMNEIPELNHNEVVGWEHDLTDVFSLIIIKEKEPHELVKKKIEATKNALDIEINFFDVVGESLLSKYLTGVFFGDLLSVYLAVLKKVNPSPVDKIEEIKERLSE